MLDRRAATTEKTRNEFCYEAQVEFARAVFHPSPVVRVRVIGPNENRYAQQCRREQRPNRHRRRPTPENCYSFRIRHQAAKEFPVTNFRQKMMLEEIADC